MEPVTDSKPSDEAMAIATRYADTHELMLRQAREIDAFAAERVNREIERRREAEAKLTRLESALRELDAFLAPRAPGEWGADLNGLLWRCRELIDDPPGRGNR